MNEYSLALRFNAVSAKSELRKAVKQKVGALTKNPELYRALNEDFYNSVKNELPKDSGAFALGKQGVKSKKTSRQDVRYGQISYTTKGLILNPYSIYKRKKDGTEKKTYYGKAVMSTHPEINDLRGPGSDTWKKFIGKAKKTIRKFGKDT